MDGLNILKVYKQSHIDAIEGKFQDKIEEIRKENLIVKRLNEIKEAVENEIDNLYKSQFEDEKDVILEYITDREKSKKLPIIMNMSEQSIILKYIPNPNYVSEKEIKIKLEAEEMKKELDKKCAACSAMLGICKTKEEYEDILVKYEIIDKKGQIQFPKNK